MLRQFSSDMFVLYGPNHGFSTSILTMQNFKNYKLKQNSILKLVQVRMEEMHKFNDLAYFYECIHKVDNHFSKGKY